MAYFINEQCIACNACKPECPTGSIFPGSPIYLIDRDSCRDCALCVGVCPVRAIHRIEGSAKPRELTAGQPAGTGGQTPGGGTAPAAAQEPSQ